MQNKFDLENTLVINASAGTGKTFTITRIIQNLILSDNRNKLRKPDLEGKELKIDNLNRLIEYLKSNFSDSVNLNEMAVITFTEKAAAELVDRVRDVMEREGSDDSKKLLAKLSSAKISTIHSFCLNILREGFVSIGIDPWFSDYNIDVYDSKLNDAFIKRTIVKFLSKNDKWTNKFSSILPKFDEINFDKVVNFVVEIINKYLYILALPMHTIDYSPIKNDKDSLKLAKYIVAFARDVYKEIRKIYLRENWLSFNSILYETYTYLRYISKCSPSSLKKIKDKIKLLIVDEFQDTDPLQWEIMKLINTKMILVGDVKQSIYKFRGATPDIFESISNATSPLKLTTNFRSTNKINNFVKEICKGPFFEKNNPDVETVEHNDNFSDNSVYYVDPFDNYEYIVKLIQWIVDNKKAENYGQITVLSRAKAPLIMLKKELLKYDIKFAFIEDEDTSLNPEIVPLRAFLNILYDPQNDSAFLSYLTSLPFSVSEDTIYKEMRDKKSSMFEILKDSKDKNIKQAIDLYREFYELKNYMSAYDIVNLFMERTLFLPKVSSLSDGENRYINVNRFVNDLRDMESSFGHFKDLIDYINSDSIIMSKSLYENDTESLKLMTIHKSKGLENRVVVYLKPAKFSKDTSSIKADFFDGKYRFNIKSLSDNKEDKEKFEEQRMFYVAITRAKESLFLIEEDGEKTTNDLLNMYIKEGYWDKDSEFLKKTGQFLTRSKIDNVELKHKTVVVPKHKDIEFDLIEDYMESSYRKFHSPTLLYEGIEDLEPLEFTEEESTYMEIKSQKLKEDGLAVHRILEHLHFGETLNSVMDKYFDYETKNLSDAEKIDIKKYLNRWKDSQFFKNLYESSESHNEFKVDKLINVDDKEIILTGVVDKVYKGDDGRWTIVDYKYSIKNERSINKYLFQMYFYAYCLKDILDIKDLKLVFLKMLPEKGVYKVNLSDVDFEDFLKKAKKLIKKSMQKTIS